MSKNVWLITGAGRGMGVEFVRAALVSGHSVVASGRDRERVSRVFGTSSDLLAVVLDVTNTADAEAAVRAAVDRFGRIDVLVNNAASFYTGYFEELTQRQIDQQLAASLIGPMNVTRAVLPVMRERQPPTGRRLKQSNASNCDVRRTRCARRDRTSGRLTRRSCNRIVAPSNGADPGA